MYLCCKFVLVKMAVFWAVEPCSSVKFTGLREVSAASINKRMKAASTAETSGNFYKSTSLNSPDGSHLLTRRFCYRLFALGKHSVKEIDLS
jgi:hypothetical protein